MNEQLLNKILDKLDHLDHDIREIKTGQAAIEQQLIAFQHFTMDKFEKLDEKITRLDGRVTRLDEKVTRLDEKVTRLDEKVTRLDERVTRLEKNLSNTNLLIENGIQPAIKSIAEQLDDHSKILNLHTEKLIRIENKIENHDIKIAVLDRRRKIKSL